MWKLWKSPQPEPGFAEIKAAMRELEARLGAMELDWHTTQKKLQRLVGHIVKTQAIDDALKLAEPKTPPNGAVRTADDLTRDEIAGMRL